MPVTYEYQLCDFAPIGDGLVAAITAAVSSPSTPVQVVGNFPTPTTDTPIVRCSFVSGSVRNNSKIIVPGIQTELQPRNAYDFTFTATIETQREQNGVLHAVTVGKARLAMQLYKLAAFGWANPQYWPYHTIRDVLELSASQLGTNDAGTTDITTLTFSGWFDISPDAWRVVAPTPVEEFTYLQPDGFAYLQPDGVSLYLQPA